MAPLQQGKDQRKYSGGEAGKMPARPLHSSKGAVLILRQESLAAIWER
jgi:hypothetical protein